MQIDLQNLINNVGLSRKEKICLIILSNENTPKAISEIKKIAQKNGLKEIEKWNVSMILKSLKGLAINISKGWILTNEGIKAIQDKELIISSPIHPHFKSLILAADNIKSVYVKEFINEAIQSLQHKLLKSAVVFSWIGAISILYEYVEKNSLQLFNNEACRRNSKWSPAKNIDGLTKMKEYDFLQIIESISLIGKNTKNELEGCLQLRNSCGHPSTLKIGEQKVASHIEILILNVYQKFS